MDYPGKYISKNHLWQRGRRGALNPVAAAWKDALANSVRYAFLAEGITPVLPLTVTVSGSFTDKNHAPDMHNLVELIADAVEEGSGGLNDRDFGTVTHPPTYDRKAVPTITITISARARDDAPAAEQERRHTDEEGGSGEEDAPRARRKRVARRV